MSAEAFKNTPTYNFVDTGAMMRMAQDNQYLYIHSHEANWGNIVIYFYK